MEQIEMRDGKTERVHMKTILIIGCLLLLTVVHVIDREELQILKVTVTDLKTQIHNLQAGVVVISNNKKVLYIYFFTIMVRDNCLYIFKYNIG